MFLVTFFWGGMSIHRNDRAMVRWICGIKLEEKVNTPSLYQHLNIPHLVNTLRYSRLRWTGHVDKSQTWTAYCEILAGVMNDNNTRLNC